MRLAVDDDGLLVRLGPELLATARCRTNVSRKILDAATASPSALQVYALLTASSVRSLRCDSSVTFFQRSLAKPFVCLSLLSELVSVQTASYI